MRPSIAFLSLFLFLSVVSLPALTGASALNDETCAKLASLHNFTGIQPLPNAAVPSSVCASVWQTNVGAVRGILVLPNRQGILTIAKQTGFLRWSKDLDGSGTIDQSSETQILLTDDDLNHGLALWGTDKLLASTDEEVYSWPFDLNDPSKPITARGTVIVRNIPDDGHSTRTLLVDRDQTWLYVSVGSDGNIDTSRDRALIKRFRLDNTIPNNGYNYATDGEVFASGLRNEVGLTWDKYGVMWGVENGADKLIRNDLGGDIHNDNPAEEVHKFTEAGKFYGYPYCWSEYNLPSPPGLGRGTQWVWPDFANDGIHSDDWCRNTSNVVRSVLNLHAHTAPLGIKFYDSTNFDTATFEDRPFTFPPASMSSPITLYIPQHGSWNREPAVGYRVIRVGVTDSENSITVSEDPNAIQNFLTYDSTTAETGDNWNMRPVDLDIGPDGEMYLTNDSGNIVVFRYFRTFDRTIPDDPSTGQPPSNPSPPTTVDDGNTANGQYQLSILTVLLAVVIALGTILMQ